MNKRITLKEALRVWRNKIVHEGRLGRHIPPAELYELLVHPPASEIKASLLDHLIRCPLCLQELKDMVDSIEEAEAWDFALPKAAASEEIEWPKKIPTEGGKYTIVIRRNMSEKNRGVVTVQVAPCYRDTLEGKKVILRDGRPHVLLTGVIIDGEVSQEIEGLNAIIPRFAVEPELSEI